MVRMYHPNIDDGKRIVEVPASAVSQHLMSGWQPADPTTLEQTAKQLLIDGGLPPEEAERIVGSSPPPPQEQTSEAPATAGASALEESPKRRRAKEGE
jgi:hypothetical protein